MGDNSVKNVLLPVAKEIYLKGYTCNLHLRKAALSKKFLLLPKWLKFGPREQIFPFRAVPHYEEVCYTGKPPESHKSCLPLKT